MMKSLKHYQKYDINCNNDQNAELVFNFRNIYLRFCASNYSDMEER